jgi:hypothetical protein
MRKSVRDQKLQSGKPHFFSFSFPEDVVRWPGRDHHGRCPGHRLRHRRVSGVPRPRRRPVESVPLPGPPTFSLGMSRLARARSEQPSPAAAPSPCRPPYRFRARAGTSAPPAPPSPSSTCRRTSSSPRWRPSRPRGSRPPTSRSTSPTPRRGRPRQRPCTRSSAASTSSSRPPASRARQVRLGGIRRTREKRNTSPLSPPVPISPPSSLSFTPSFRRHQDPRGRPF